MSSRPTRPARAERGRPHRARRPEPADPPWRARLPGRGLTAALVLIALSMAVPAVFDWNVRINSFPPIHAEWDPRVGWGTVPALALAAVGGLHLRRWCEELGWGRVLLVVYALGLAWMLALAYVDGNDGVGQLLDDPYEYMNSARTYADDFGGMLQQYVSRISYDAEPNNWPVHIAGHPPGAVGFYIVLVRLGITTGYGAGLATVVLSATAPLAVLVTLKVLGSEQIARRAAPFLTLGPAAIWICVSADGLFAAVAAWGLACLALAATRTDTRRLVAWSALAGLLLGYAVMMSYGLFILGILCLAVLWLGGRWQPLPIAAVAAALVVLAFAAFGFYYWDAFGQLHERYWDGVGGRRTPLYWMWGNLAAFCLSAGPMVGAGVAWLLGDKARPRFAGAVGGGHAPDRRRPQEQATGLAALVERLPQFPDRRSPRHAVWVLAAAGALTVLTADVSQMSKAEVERIWLPFVPWTLLGCALLPERWRVRGLWIQVAAALVVQHLVRTTW